MLKVNDTVKITCPDHKLRGFTGHIVELSKLGYYVNVAESENRPADIDSVIFLLENDVERVSKPSHLLDVGDKVYVAGIESVLTVKAVATDHSGSIRELQLQHPFGVIYKHDYLCVEATLENHARLSELFTGMKYKKPE